MKGVLPASADRHTGSPYRTAPMRFTDSLFSLSRPRDEFFQPVQIQRPWHQLGPNNESRCSGDPEFVRKRSILVNDTLPLGVGYVGFQPFGVKPDRGRNLQNLALGHV